MIECILEEGTNLNKKEINRTMDYLKGNDFYLNSNRINTDEINDLIEYINKTIDSGKLVMGLDRLHTLMIKYIKELCLKHDIHFNDNDRLDVIFKNYSKYIKEYIDSDMSLTILKSSISLFSQFNNIRNNYTYAHDNKILNDAESKLILKNILNVKEFIDTLENNMDI